MEQPTYPDPLTQALGRAAQRSGQLASIVMTAGQVFAWYRAQRQQEQVAAGEQAAREAREQLRRLPTWASGLGARPRPAVARPGGPAANRARLGGSVVAAAQTSGPTTASPELR